MTMELVDGRKGEPHIDSTDMGILHQALYGKGSYVLDWGQDLGCVMSDANHAVVGTGCGMIQGLCFTVTGSETIQIDSGSQSQQRNDIIVAHYHRDTSGVETVNLEVITGTETSGTPADPTIPSGIILEGATDAYMPLWRIPISGIMPGTPVSLFETLPSLRDSVTRVATGSYKVPYSDNSLALTRVGSVVTCAGGVTIKENQREVDIIANEVMPLGFRPSGLGGITSISSDSNGKGMLAIYPDGRTRIVGDMSSLVPTYMAGTWITDDPWPAD